MNWCILFDAHSCPDVSVKNGNNKITFFYYQTQVVLHNLQLFFYVLREDAQNVTGYCDFLINVNPD